MPEESRVNSRLGPVSELTRARPLSAAGPSRGFSRDSSAPLSQLSPESLPRPKDRHPRPRSRARTRGTGQRPGIRARGVASELAARVKGRGSAPEESRVNSRLGPVSELTALTSAAAGRISTRLARIVRTRARHRAIRV